MSDLVAVDVGGTHARFARASISDTGVPTLGPVLKYKVAEHSSLAACWRHFLADDGGTAPRFASVAFATAIGRDVIKLTNSNWIVKPATLADELGVERVHLVNDFEAIAHAITKLPADHLPVLFGPQRGLPDDGVVTVVGPGTGLGVAIISYQNGAPRIMATEGGHLDFAPLDAVETRLLDCLRERHLRVSTERLVSGPGLNNIYRGLAVINHEKVELLNDSDLWAAALDRDSGNMLAHEALDRLCLNYGAVAGDLALAHGPGSVVLVGGLTIRMRDHLVKSGFHSRFTAKGRFESLMSNVAIHIAMHDEIGLFGAAAAFRYMIIGVEG